MKRTFTAACLTALLTAPAYAGWFSSDPSCDASDVACLKELALTTLTTEIKDEEPHNHSGPGRRFSMLEPLLEKDERSAAFEKIEAVNPSDSFWGQYESDSARASSRKAMNYDGILSAVEGRGYPEEIKWGNFISDAVLKTINGPDADKLAGLFLSEQAFFARYAERASVPIIAHLARHDLDRLKAFAADPDNSKNTLLQSLTPLALEAESACLEGDATLGKRIMAFRDSYAETQVYSPELGFLPLVNSFPFILACEGEEQAIAELAKIEAGLESVPTGETVTYRGLTMSIDAMRVRYVMDYVVLPMSYHFNDTGRVDQAKALFEKYKAASVELAYDAEGKPVYVTDGIDHPLFKEYTETQKIELGTRISDLMDYEWDQALERRAESERYATDLSTRLDYFVNRFDPPFKICCSDGQGVETMIEDIVTASASAPVPAKALERALALVEKAKAADKRVGISSDAVTRVRLSRAEKPVGCALSEDRLNDLLVEIEEIEDAGARTIGILAMIQYQQTPLGARTDAPCVID